MRTQIPSICTLLPDWHRGRETPPQTHYCSRERQREKEMRGINVKIDWYVKNTPDPSFSPSVLLADLSVSGRRSGAPCWSGRRWALCCEVLFDSGLNSGSLWVVMWICRGRLFFVEELEFSFTVEQSETDVLSTQGCSLYRLLFTLFAMGCVSLVTLDESPSIRLNVEPGGVREHSVHILNHHKF